MDAFLDPLGEEGGSFVEGEFSALEEDIAETEILSACRHAVPGHDEVPVGWWGAVRKDSVA